MATKAERRSALLLAGWHNICKGDEDLWAHPECDYLMPMEMAEKVEARTSQPPAQDKEE